MWTNENRLARAPVVTTRHRAAAGAAAIAAWKATGPHRSSRRPTTGKAAEAKAPLLTAGG